MTFPLFTSLIFTASLFATGTEQRPDRIVEYVGTRQSQLCLKLLSLPGNPDRKQRRLIFLRALQRYESRTLSEQPLNEIPYKHFLNVVFEALQIRYPDKIENFPKKELERWFDLKPILGFNNFSEEFGIQYPLERNSDGESILNLRGTFDNLQTSSGRLDHGRDPLRNGFLITLMRFGQHYAFRIHDGYDESFDRSAIDHYLAMYDAFASHGLPISLLPELVRIIEGS